MSSSTNSTRLIQTPKSEEHPVTHGSARRVRAVSHEEGGREGARRWAYAMRCVMRRAGSRHGEWDGIMDACHAHQDACTSQQQLRTRPECLSARQGCWRSCSHKPPAASRAELARLSCPHDPIEETRTSVRSCQRARCRATAANSAAALFCLQISRISLFYHSGCMPNFNLTPQAASAFPRTPNPSVWDRLTRG